MAAEGTKPTFAGAATAFPEEVPSVRAFGPLPTVVSQLAESGLDLPPA